MDNEKIEKDDKSRAGPGRKAVRKMLRLLDAEEEDARQMLVDAETETRKVSANRMRSKAQRIIATNRRDRAMFRLMFDRGLRRGEVLSLDLEDLTLEAEKDHLLVCGTPAARR